ncbi:MAG: diguanylate cyclase [Burkholderiales bacterium]|nr:diguanylate cyclase [Burkholderiales bacterium]
MLNNLSARLRIVLVVVASTLPVLALTYYLGMLERDRVELLERDELQIIAELTAKRPEQLIEGARHLLSSVALNLDSLMETRRGCRDYFRRLVDGLDGSFRAAGLILPDGELYCNSALEADGPLVNVGDRQYFRSALSTGEFAVGDFQVGRLSGQSGINFAYPVASQDGGLRAVLFLGLNLEKFIEQGQSRRESVFQRYEDRLITIYDRNGIVLAQYPHLRYKIGQKSPNPAVNEALATPAARIFKANDQFGVPRLYAVENVGKDADGNGLLRVIVSQPLAALHVHAERMARTTAIGILLVMTLVIALAWFGAGAIVLRSFRRLLKTADRLRNGDFTARTGLGKGREELAQVGAAIDAMAEQLQIRDLKLQEVMQQLNELAVTDQLTGLPNRRYLWDRLSAELMRARRKDAPLSVLLFDIDHFKDFNDRWGHEAGDLVLRNVAHAIRRVVRGSDIVARHGGEEFVIVLPEAGEDIALLRAEELRREISALRLTFGGEALGTITVSVGVVCSRHGSSSAEDLVRAADHAMYEAKQGGRDRVVLAAAR